MMVRCIICGDEAHGSIGGKDICPGCDCGIGVILKNGELVKDSTSRNYIGVRNNLIIAEINNE